MEFTKISYEIFKIKYDIKYNQVFFYSGARLNAKNWLTVEQLFKKIELNSYKIYNIIATRVVENSVFKNSKFFINGVTLFTVTVLDKKDLTLSKNKFDIIHAQVAFMSVSINNKIYSNSQIKFVNTTNYTKNIINFCQMLNTKLKTFCIKIIFFQNSVI